MRKVMLHLIAGSFQSRMETSGRLVAYTMSKDYVTRSIALTWKPQPFSPRGWGKSHGDLWILTALANIEASDAQSVLRMLWSDYGGVLTESQNNKRHKTHMHITPCKLKLPLGSQTPGVCNKRHGHDTWMRQPEHPKSAGCMAHVPEQLQADHSHWCHQEGQDSSSCLKTTSRNKKLWQYLICTSQLLGHL